MNDRYQVKILLLISVVVVCILSLIQYYLVNNSYQLTKGNYYTEVKREMGKITASHEIEAINDTAKEILKLAAHQYVSEGLNKQGFFNRLRLLNKPAIVKGNRLLQGFISKNRSLQGVRYKSQYDDIVLEINGKSDTLLASSKTPFLHLGWQFNTNNTFILSTGDTYSTDNEHIKVQGRVKTYESFKLHFLQSQYVDVSAWKDVVVRRMYGVFLLAILLIIGVIAVFFLVFQAMLKQRKLTEIKTDFANNITHELKTPLSSISIIFKSLDRPDVMQNSQLLDEMLVSLKRQFNKIQHTVESVLDSATADKISDEISSFDVSSFLTIYIKRQTSITHQLIADISTYQTVISGNVDLLEKVLDNLLQNAAKYTKGGSVIKLKSWVDGNWVLITISDEGPGIAKKHQKYIFEKFYRVPELNKHTVKGLGLGLYLAKQAIMRLKGVITLESTVEKGSTFTIKLPINEC
jgi:two-component system phosphate regulon sensor histidine kinase PhoR